MPDYLEGFDGAPLPDELQPWGVVYQAIQSMIDAPSRSFLSATELACIALAPIPAPWLPSLHPIRIGDPDPTPAPEELPSFCGEVDIHGVLILAPLEPRCTWAPGHRGVHVAGDGEIVTAVWDGRTAQVHLSVADD